ncbi:ORF6N domain-containing protein [Salmonella enterica subsp. enterica]|nr:ORF6N domain-containing protein [Salmonella enterica subsp. enterica serovar Gombe]
MNTVTINNKQLPAVEYRGQRVVTFAMIDEVHQRPEGTARAAFNRNRSHFIEGVDFLEMTADVIRTESLSDAFAARTAKGIILFESGYLMLTKPFNDDLAWQVQRELVNNYFRSRAPLTEIEMIAAMAADAVRQQKRIAHVEEKVVEVVELVDSIARGATPPGWAGYSELMPQCGMSDKKMRQLVSAYDVEHKKIPFIAPGGTKSTMTIVPEDAFMAAFRQMMSEAEPRGTRWYHPKMGLFQAIGWEA